MIDESALMAKLHAWEKVPENRKRMDAKIKEISGRDGVATTAAGSRVRTEEDMLMAADKFIDILQRCAEDANLPESVMAHFRELFASRPVKLPNGETVVVVRFGGDLHRDSLENDLGYEGIDNIVALFNNGYKAGGTVYGWWNGHSPTTAETGYRSGSGENTYAWVPSKAERPALKFIQQAVADFNGNYGADYGAVAIAGEDYSKKE